MRHVRLSFVAISIINDISRILYEFMLCYRAQRRKSLSPQRKESSMHVPQWVKPGFWGGVIGAIGIMIVGFGWLGWTLGSTAESLAQERVNAALVAAFTPICVERFMTQPDVSVKLTEFQKTSSWRQQEFVEKGGWATLPGNKEPNTKVAGACAGQLTKTNKT
jgi:hypothetical protein